MEVKSQAEQGGKSAHSFKLFLYVSKTLFRNPQDFAVSWKLIQFLTKGNSNKTQNLTFRHRASSM